MSATDKEHIVFWLIPHQSGSVKTMNEITAIYSE